MREIFMNQITIGIGNEVRDSNIQLGTMVSCSAAVLPTDPHFYISLQSFLRII
jgi:hypothetical protein